MQLRGTSLIDTYLQVHSRKLGRVLVLPDTGVCHASHLFGRRSQPLITFLIGVPFVSIVAAGRVATTGWGNPQLSGWVYVAPPADGIQDFDFCADEPSGIILPVLTPFAAYRTIDRDWRHFFGRERPLRGVRVHSRTNSVEAMVAEAHEVNLAGRPESAVGGDLPFPFAASLSSLIGTTLRVYKTGDPLTKDFAQDRTDIELDPASRRIVRVWFG